MGSSGGGGSSGKSDWPQYMKDMHMGWIENMETLRAAAATPYTGAVAYDPDTGDILTNLGTALSAFEGFHTSVGLTMTEFKATWDGITSAIETSLGAAVVADLDVNIVPTFEAGMRDINAVQTSSFVLGKSMLYARVGLEVAKLAALNTKQMMDSAIMYGESLRARFQANVDYAKIVTIAYKEYTDRQLEIDVESDKWIYFIYRECGALLGSIGGTAAAQSSAKPSPTASAIGGAMTGAAAGAAIGSMGPQATVGGTIWGAAIGAVVGGVGGYLSAS